MKLKRPTKGNYTSPYQFEGRIPLVQAIPLGLQHVLAMFVGNLTPLIMVMATCNITADDGFGALSVSLLQNAMLVAGIVTLIQLFPIGPIGGRLPIVMGTSSGFIGINNAIATSMIGAFGTSVVTNSPTAGIYAYGAIMGACLIGGVFEMGLGFCIKPLRKFFPPVVTGTVVMAIGLSLVSVGIGFFGGGNNNADYGHMYNLLLGMITLISILIFKHAFKGFPSIASILLGIIVGYIASFIMGLFLPHEVTVMTQVTEQISETVKQVSTVEKTVTASYLTDWASVREAAWFALPKIMPVKLQFNIGAIVPMCIMFIVTAVETVGDTAAVVEGGMNREATDKELSGSVVCDGFGSALATVFGVLPNTSFSQNVGLVGMTKMVNRFAISMGAGILILCGLFPKIGAIISAMPQPVLGGAAIMMFANIIISGIQLITKEPLTGRNATIVSVALGLGYGLGSTTAVQAFMPQWMTYIFGGSGIVPAALIAIVLNIILREKAPKKAAANASGKKK